MIYAHRGNRNGPNPNRENKIAYIAETLSCGYGVEVDVQLKTNLYLGHDEPQEAISRIYLENSKILAHCKTLDTFNYLSQFKNIHSFYQTNEPVVVTTWGHLLYHSDTIKYFRPSHGIIVDLEGNTVDYNNVITDYAGKYRLDQKKIFKVLALDVDGVLTNGKKIYSKDHIPQFKEFSDIDFTAIKRFKAAGIQVVIVSGDEFNRGMAEKRNLDFINAREISSDLDKSKCLPLIIKKYGVTPAEIAYVGDDYYDISLLNSVGYAFCPRNAAICVKSVAQILDADGGNGVIDILYEKVKNNLNA